MADRQDAVHVASRHTLQVPLVSLVQRRADRQRHLRRVDAARAAYLRLLNDLSENRPRYVVDAGAAAVKRRVGAPRFSGSDGTRTAGKRMGAA
jgi:hypothetical protein